MVKLRSKSGEGSRIQKLNVLFSGSFIIFIYKAP